VETAVLGQFAELAVKKRMSAFLQQQEDRKFKRQGIAIHGIYTYITSMYAHVDELKLGIERTIKLYAPIHDPYDKLQNIRPMQIMLTKNAKQSLLAGISSIFH
jgi:hypothetical protein